MWRCCGVIIGCLFLFVVPHAIAEPHGDIALPPVATADVFSADVGQIQRTWCGSATAAQSPAPENSIVVIYAHAADAPSRLAQYGSVFSRSIYDASNAFSVASNSLLVPRWQLGNDCSPNVIAIREVRLAGIGTSYATDPFAQVAAEIRPLIPSKTVAMVFVDGVPNKYGGQGEQVSDDQPSDSNANANGGRMAIVWGKGGSDFLGSNTVTSSVSGIVLHELIHVLGGVQNTAPHTTGAGHCTDGADVMCYADGGPTAVQQNICAQARVGWNLDCNNDDYFSMAPNGYLANHWNIARSPFLCNGCVNAPSLNIAIKANRMPTVWQPLTLTTDSPMNTVYLWDFGDGTTSPHPTHWYKKPGQYTVRAVGNQEGTQFEASTIITVKPSTISPQFPTQSIQVTARRLRTRSIEYPPARIKTSWKIGKRTFVTTQQRWNNGDSFVIPRQLPKGKNVTVRFAIRVGSLKVRIQQIKLRKTLTGRVIAR